MENSKKVGFLTKIFQFYGIFEFSQENANRKSVLEFHLRAACKISVKYCYYLKKSLSASYIPYRYLSTRETGDRTLPTPAGRGKGTPLTTQRLDREE